MTSVHSPFDVRIMTKECQTLSETGYDVSLVVPHTRDESIGNVTVRHVLPVQCRTQRLTTTAFAMLRTALGQQADIYHVHDPELVPAGLILRALGYRVVYDAHEDLAKQVLSKSWIPKPLRPAASVLARAVQISVAWWFDGIVAATPAIASKFPAQKTTVVQNFPVLAEFMVSNGPTYQDRDAIIAYVGGITSPRGVREMVRAMELLRPDLDAGLVLAGDFPSESLLAEVSSMDGWLRTEYVGWLGRSHVASLLSRARIGLVVLHPLANYIDSYPVKLFEYMASGIPVVASGFPLWKSIVEGVGCGIVVNPLNAREIAGAIEWLLVHPEEAYLMGEAGRRAIISRYNWATEANKLIRLYARLLSGLQGAADQQLESDSVVPPRREPEYWE